MNRLLGSGALPGKIFLLRIIENNKIDAYFKVRLALPALLEKGLG